MAERTNADFWRTVQRQLAADLDEGFRHVLTEDWLRAVTMRALAARGVRPAHVRIEEPSPGGGRTDLVVRGEGTETEIEFKFPREPRATNAADTMAVGALVNDLLRLAESGRGRRLAVQLLEERFVGHLSRRDDVQLLAREGQELILEPHQLARLPRSASVMFAGRTLERPVRATCLFAQRVGDLTLQVLEVG